MGEVIVLTKVPERGFVKTRLAKKLPAQDVEELYTAFLTDTLAKLSDYDPYVAYYPERKLQMLWTILGDRKYIVQKGKGLWERLQRIFDDFYRLGYEYVAAVTCDVPLLTKQDIEEAFSAMQDHDIVLGPANDGGLYLIGGKKISSSLFEGVEWKSPDAFKKIMENAKGLGLKTAELTTQQDVDTPEDLAAVWESGQLDKKGKTYEVLKGIYKK